MRLKIPILYSCSLFKAAQSSPFCVEVTLLTLWIIVALIYFSNDDGEKANLKGGRCGVEWSRVSLWGISLSAVWDAVWRFELQKMRKKQRGDDDISTPRAPSWTEFIRISMLESHYQKINVCSTEVWIWDYIWILVYLISTRYNTSAPF